MKKDELNTYGRTPLHDTFTFMPGAPLKLIKAPFTAECGEAVVNLQDTKMMVVQHYTSRVRILQSMSIPSLKLSKVKNLAAVGGRRDFISIERKWKNGLRYCNTRNFI